MMMMMMILMMILMMMMMILLVFNVPLSARCNAVGHPQNPSPPRTNTFLGAADAIIVNDDDDDDDDRREPLTMPSIEISIRYHINNHTNK